MIRRRALVAGIRAQIGNHTIRATGITEYLRNGGKLEIAQRMANHESARTTGLKTCATIRCRWMRVSGY
jgi:site-specific recombinase XerD